MKNNIHLSSYLDQFFVEGEMSQKNVVEKIRTYILCSKTFFFANRAIYDTVFEKHCKAGHATNHKIAYVHYMFNN